MGKTYFGKDGIRRASNAFPMPAEIALRVGMAAGNLFHSGGERRRLAVIGEDTRLSVRASGIEPLARVMAEVARAS